MKNGLMFHEQFMSEAQHLIENITKLERKGNIKDALKKNLELCYLKVNYYEQWIKSYDSMSNYYKLYNESYYYALLELAFVRDKCMDVGIFEE